MKKLYITAVTILAAGLMLHGNAQAQQTPASTPSPAPAAKAPLSSAAKSPAAKIGQAPAAKSKSDVALGTEKDKLSYAIGVNVGRSLQKDSVEVDPSIVVQGLKDALAGGKTLMTDDEAKAVKILTAGTGAKPSATDSVVCNYKGTLIDGTEFDSSYKRGQPATFPVDKVIKGWTEALQLMPVGSKWQLFVPAEMAYGARGPSPTIGANAVLIFEVELLSIQAKDK